MKIKEIKTKKVTLLCVDVTFLKSLNTAYLDLKIDAGAEKAGSAADLASLAAAFADFKRDEEVDKAAMEAFYKPEVKAGSLKQNQANQQDAFSREFCSFRFDLNESIDSLKSVLNESINKTELGLSKKLIV
jgi:hypothetical protein